MTILLKFRDKVRFKNWCRCNYRHDYTIDRLGVLKACDACADMGQL